MTTPVFINPHLNHEDLLDVLMRVQRSMMAAGEAPDIPFIVEVSDPAKDWYDPRRPLATDVWRVLAGLPPRYHK